MDDREFLRHTVATLAYRASKPLRDAPESFAQFDGGGKAPIAIVAHLGDLLDWALSMANGERKWNDTTAESWSAACDRFFAALQRFDDYLASDAAINCSTEKLFQGPIADALTHVGQLAMLRRMAGTPTIGENYFAAEIAKGRVGIDQPPPRRPFK